MSRSIFPFVAEDVSALAKALGRELGDAGEKPGHVQLLNILVRAVGYRNFQHFRAQQVAEERLAAPRAAPPSPVVDLTRVARAARHFDAAGDLARWPSKASLRDLCVWVMWSRLPAGETLTEKDVNAHLRRAHHFDDPALLRRLMVDMGLLWRTRDGRVYRRIERRPPDEALALIRHVALIPSRAPVQ